MSYNPTANGYRLPTEAEWLQAADDGHECSGADMVSLGEVAWYKGNSGRKTHKVKTKAPNAKGIYDMSGNVSEYVWGKYTGVGSSPSYGYDCGGSWDSRKTASEDACVVSYFSTSSIGLPYRRSDTTGFRVVRNAN